MLKFRFERPVAPVALQAGVIAQPVGGILFAKMDSWKDRQVVALQTPVLDVRHEVMSVDGQVRCEIVERAIAGFPVMSNETFELTAQAPRFESPLGTYELVAYDRMPAHLTAAPTTQEPTLKFEALNAKSDAVILQGGIEAQATKPQFGLVFTPKAALVEKGLVEKLYIL